MDSVVVGLQLAKLHSRFVVFVFVFDRTPAMCDSVARACITKSFRSEIRGQLQLLICLFCFVHLCGVLRAALAVQGLALLAFASIFHGGLRLALHCIRWLVHLLWCVICSHTTSALR